MDIETKIKSGLLGSIAGDALGVPVESTTRAELALCAVKNMLGYGRFDQPKGTWSDDSALALCTMESLLKGYDIDDIGQTFCKWLFDSYWTPSGYVFDVGLTTFMALDSIKNDNSSARDSGRATEDDNGNGSLMRILPAAIFFRKEKTSDFLGHIHEISAITHSHSRSKMGCGIYSLLARALIENDNKIQGYCQATEAALEYYSGHEEFKDDLGHYGRILSGEIPDLEDNDIQSSGYIVDTLEAALWCFFRFNSTKEILLAAVNLGLETDTTGTLAGGIGGIFHGIDSLPEDWLTSLARKSELDTLIQAFVKKVS